MKNHDLIIEVWNSVRQRIAFDLPDRQFAVEFHPYAVAYAPTDTWEACESLILLNCDDEICQVEATSEENHRGGLTSWVFNLERTLEVVPTAVRAVLNRRGSRQVVELPIEVRKLSGFVTDFRGDPIAGGFVPIGKDRGRTGASDVALAITDSTGHYEVWLPPGLYRKNHALLQTYGTETMECYLMELSLEDDRRIDFRIGSLEIAKLAATPVEDERIFSARFICWTINSFCLPRYTAIANGEKAEIDDPRFYPQLHQDEVQVLVDGEEAEVVGFAEAPVQCMTGIAVPGYYVDCVLPKGVDRGTHTLTVTVRHEGRTPKGELVTEEGEAHLCSLRWPE